MKYLKLFEKFHTNICPLCLERYLTERKSQMILEGNSDFVRSLSIVVPTKGCVNSCKFCVSKLTDNDRYDDNSKKEFFDDEYFKKMKYVKEKGGKFAILTGDAEPMQNKKFLQRIGQLNKMLDEPFIMEIQTTGVMLNDTNLDFLKNEVGVDVISLSVSDMFDNNNNANTIRIHKNLRFNLEDLCERIKNKGFTLRLSINLIDEYNKYTPEEILERLIELQPDQAIFRVLWCSDDEDNEINKWIKSNSASKSIVKDLNMFIIENGKHIGDLPTRFDINGISIVVDDDCMARKKIEQFRYLILRQDCNLYTKWDSDVPHKIKEL